ncbi:MAG: TIGR02301 family protein [bacterium]
MRQIFLIPCLLWFSSPAFAQEAMENWAKRDNDLIELSRVIGQMHHLHRICHPYDYADLYKDRIKQLITLEVPQEKIKKQMIDAYNEGYNRMKTDYYDCDYRAAEEVSRLSQQGEQLANRLAAPFRDVDGYDYGDLLLQDQGSIENGVTIYRGQQH